MSPWYRLSLGDGTTSGFPSDEIEETFHPAFVEAGSPPEMAVFTRPESEDRLHCEVIAYFSPAASEIAEAFDAEPCEKPVRSGLALLGGDEECWSALFDETEGPK